MATGKHKILLTLCTLLLLILACSEGSPTSDSTSGSTSVAGDTAVVQTVLQGTDQFQVYVPNISSSALSGESSQNNTESGFDPHVIVETGSNNINMGELLTLIGRPVQIGKPVYYLIVRDEGVQDAPTMATATHDNVITLESGSSQILEAVSARADSYQVEFVLRAKAPGKTTVTVIAMGEVQASYPGPETIPGEGSGSILITVGDG